MKTQELFSLVLLLRCPSQGGWDGQAI